MLQYRVILIVCLSGLLAGCHNPEKKKSSDDFFQLSEDQKRLPENALSSMTVREGLEVELFAAEPMVTNPTNISVDHLGRVWVCEAYNYDVSPEQEDKKGDRIVVLEDTDHDGKADKRTVFYQGTDITTPLGILVSGNQVYVTRSPNVLIFTDTNGDLVADNKDTLFTNLGKKGDHSAHSMFPGPDGKLYFSTGNFAGAISDREGNPIVDKAGFAVNQTGKPYLGGMVMRFSPDGTEFEVLGHNFRNNYEPCIDSYGNIWQSDNDDDGNESCRINFVMPYGNYGYVDEMTRASWSTNRVNIEEKVSERHWHQKDPGVVPNVLITGAGSPAGMAMYEGDQLGLKGVPVHAEPYYNVVRAYIPEKKGAGYTASVEDILKSSDQWFRPVDVCTAPDGSLFIADWYDPILGGGAAGDAVQGRIYRVAVHADEYNVPRTDLTSIEGSIEALKSPNLETRFLAFQKLSAAKEEARPALLELWKSQDQLHRIRAFWLLIKIDSDDTILKETLEDADPAMRTTAVRAVLQNKKDVTPYLKLVVNDKDPSVRREVATSLRYTHTEAGAALWTELANHYDGEDRWYLEALGIGADLHADLYFNFWRNNVKMDLNNKAHQDLIWRMRSPAALPLLAELIRSYNTGKESERYFRAFDFHTSAEKNKVLAGVMNMPGPKGEEITALALRQIDPAQITMTPALKKALTSALGQTKGTIAYVDLAGKFGLQDQKDELVRLAIEESGKPLASAAVDLLIRWNAFKEFENVLSWNNQKTTALLESLKGKGNKEIIDRVSAVVSDSKNSINVRQAAVQTLGSSWPGEERLLQLVKEKSFSPDLKPVAASILFNVYRSSIQREAANYLPKPSGRENDLPPIKQLVASNGSMANGKEVFKKLCTSCHRIGNEGVKFAPELTQIGSKSSKEGLYRAILFPDDGISYGYESTLVTLADGSQSMGIIESETDNEIALNQPGGAVTKFTKAQVKEKQKSDKSLMPALASAMTEQELVDLVSYLSSLK